MLVHWFWDRLKRRGRDRLVRERVCFGVRSTERGAAVSARVKANALHVWSSSSSSVFIRSSAPPDSYLIRKMSGLKSGGKFQFPTLTLYVSTGPSCSDWHLWSARSDKLGTRAWKLTRSILCSHCGLIGIVFALAVGRFFISGESSIMPLAR